MTEPRFYIDHGMIHDRKTGKHVTTEPDSPFCDGIVKCRELLNELAGQREPRTFPLLVSTARLAEQIAADPDIECEAGRDLSEKAVTFLPQHDDEDMVAVGRAFMEAIDQARMVDPWVKDWSPSQCPSEIIFNLINQRDEAQELAIKIAAAASRT